MTNMNDNPAAQEDLVEHLIDAFEARLAAADDAAAAGSSIDIADFLPATTHLHYHQTVVEMLRVDLEHHRQHALPITLESYIQRFSETLSNAEYLEPLAFEDYRLRCQLGEELTPRQFGVRFGIDTSAWPSRTQIVQQSRGESPNLAENDDCYPRAGDTLLDFQIVTEFGRGAFSRVFLARQNSLANRLVVLKASRQFWNESDLLARLQHTNIVPIHSVFRHGDIQIVCMPFWGTCTLADVLSKLRNDQASRSQPWTGETLISTIANHQNESVASALGERRSSPSVGTVAPVNTANATVAKDSPTNAPSPQPKTAGYVETCLGLVAQIADALSHAHQRDIIHRDLKPANVLIADDGRPMILDFNLSVDSVVDTKQAIGGTLPYMAPEHLRAMQGNATLPQAGSDIFSLGVILFELLTGEKPFPHRAGLFERAADQMIQDRESVTPSVRAVNPNVPSSVDAIVRRCLAARLDARYATASHLHEDLQRQLDQRSLLHAKDSARERLAKWYHRKPWIAWAALATVCCIVALAALLGFSQQTTKASTLWAGKQYREFARDSEWIAVALSTSGMDSQYHNEANELARQWLEKYAAIGEGIASEDVGVRFLGADERNAVKCRMGELYVALADAQATTASGIEDRGEQKACYEKALQFNKSASQYFDETPVALELQRARLLAASGMKVPPATARKSAIVVPPPQATENALTTTTPQIEPAQIEPLRYELLGNELLHQSKPREALDVLERANEQSPQDYSVLIRLGNAHHARNAWSDAEVCFRVCIALRPDVPFGYFQRGLVRLERTRFHEALSDFDAFLKRRPDSIAGHINRAIALRGCGQSQAAQSALLAAIERGCQEPRVYLLLSDLCHTLGDRVGGQQFLAQGLDMTASDERNWRARGAAMLKLGKPGQALAQFQQALRCEPNSVNAMKHIASVLSDHLDRTEEAIELLNNAIRLLPEDAELLSSRGVLLARVGDFVAAREDVMAALELNQDVPTLIRAGCAFAITQQGEDDVSIAVEYVRRAIAMDPKWAAWVADDPDLDQVRDDPRFQETMAAANTLLRIGK